MDMNRHKVFISYFHHDDQYYKDALTEMRHINGKYQLEPIFDDYSVDTGDIDDSHMTDEQIRVKIRDEYMKEATVLIVLCGQNTKHRKHVDWEIHTAMYDSEANGQMGIIVLNLPTIDQSVRVCNESEKPLVYSGPCSWTKFETRQEYEEAYPYMPKRILDNMVAGKPITVANWGAATSNPEKLMELIDNAFRRKDSFSYDHHEPLRRKNS